jgi:hypothetical protein
MEPDETEVMISVVDTVYNADQHTFELISNRFCLQDHGLKSGDKVKITITKEPKLDAQFSSAPL